MKLKFLIITAAAVFLCGCALKNKAPKEATETLFAMDTEMTLTACGENCETALSAAKDEINRLNGLFSVTDQNSEIYKLNTEKTAPLSEETYELLEKSADFYNKTEGLLNIALYPVTKCWGFTTGGCKIPSSEELSALKPHTDPSAITYDAETHTVTLTDPQAEVDLGSVAKGYAAAKIKEIFQEKGVTSGIISLGGNVQTIGRKPDGSLWRIAVLNPDDQSQYVGVIETEDKAVVTSGSYQRYFEENGKRYCHIIDPRTCAPAESGLSSVTIVSENALLADAYSTALFIMGKDLAADFWRQNKAEFDAVLITADGEIIITEGLSGSFTPTDDTADITTITE